MSFIVGLQPRYKYSQQKFLCDITSISNALSLKRDDWIVMCMPNTSPCFLQLMSGDLFKFLKYPYKSHTISTFNRHFG